MYRFYGDLIVRMIDQNECSNVSIIADFGYDWYSKLSLFKFQWEKILFQDLKPTLTVFKWYFFLTKISINWA